MRLKKSANKILKECMGLKSDESCLIVTDKNKLEIGEALLDSAKEITKGDVELIEIPVGERHGKEPDSHVAKRMREFDVVLIPTTKSLSHTKARKEACATGARLASMPGITNYVFLRVSDADLNQITDLNKKIGEILDKGREVHVTTEKGTDIKFSINRRNAKQDSGLLLKKGDSGNIPAGEVFLAPVEGTANGVFIIDNGVGGIGRTKKEIRVEVKDGFAVKIEGNNELVKTLQKVKDKNAYNIAEFGIGTNKKARITGNTLEDEKVLGTCHIAFGNNSGFGGKISVPVHIDGIISKPTILVDGEKMMVDGKLVV